MAKNKITDFSTTAATNTDVGGVDIQGTAPASNMDDSVREVMSILAETNAGTAPWADSMTIGDTADLTKELRFELSAITAGQTRVITVPDANVTIPSGTLVTESSTSTLTNKTLTSPTINSPTIATPAITGTTSITTTSDTASGASLQLVHVSASPAVDDNIANISAIGRDSAGNVQSYGIIQHFINNPFSGAEYGRWAFSTIFNGTLDIRMNIAGGLHMAGTTDPGAGKINATEYQASGTALPFHKAYESAQQTITAGGSLTLAHSLGTKPKLYLIVLQCTTAEFGFSIGDEVIVNPSSTDIDDHRGATVVPDATNMNIRFGTNANTFSVLRYDTGASAQITNSSWRLVVRAWA